MTARRACLALALAAAAWTAAIVVTGGFSLQLAGIRVSSHAARNPALLTALAAGAAVLLARPRYWPALSDDARWWARTVAGVSPAAWLLLSGAALHLAYWIAAPPLWLDEEMIALNIRDRSFADLAGPLWLGQGAPLGWLATERLVAVTIGLGEAALRFVPAAFGVATLVAAWWIGRRTMSRVGAAALVFLLAFGQWAFHYSLELKHYSADVCFGLLVPGLAVWVMDGADAPRRVRRAAVWWAVAAVAEWWSMGGLLATPACALVIGIALWRTDGFRRAATFAAWGVAWLALFAVHYALALRFTAESSYLRSVWASAMPPAGAGAWGRLVWVAQQAAPFADKPGGTGLAAIFWTAVAAGFVFARRRLAGLVFATVPVSAAILAALRIVPLFERLSIWVLPALYVGVALALDAAVAWGRDGFARRRPAQGVAAAVMAAAVLAVCVDAGQRSRYDIPIGHPSDSNHQIDDRTGVRWVDVQRRPGDAILTTRLAAPGLWWYADVSIAPPRLGARIGDTPIFEVAYHPPNPECGGDLAEALAPYDRVLVYFGFRFDDVPDGFDDLLLRRLDRMGSVTAVEQFAGLTRAAVVELAPPARRAAGSDPVLLPEGPLDGCLTVRPATRW